MIPARSSSTNLRQRWIYPPNMSCAGILRKLARSGIGIVMVTHHLSDLIPEIERVILMSQGSVVA
jgi:ABC-type molybdenum transport system ATPase subunit/photorepair protein PhrA